MSIDITLKVKEQKTISFTFKDSSGAIIPLTDATFHLIMENSEGTDVITKQDESGSDFDKSQVASGIVKTTFTDDDLDLPAGTYKLELKTTFTTGEIDKSKSFVLNLVQAITD